MQKITPHLWFNTNAEEAAQFYTSIFRNGQVHGTTHYTEAGFEVHGMPAGTVLTVAFEIEGYQFVALNGGPHFTFNPALSFMVYCTSPEEVDELYGKLAEGGTPLMPLDVYPFSPRYGWIQDKYGVSWQVIYTEAKQVRHIVPSFLFIGEGYGRAEEAIDLYVSVFPDAKKGAVAKYGADQAPNKEGAVMYADFILAGQPFAAMDGADAQHNFRFNEAISLLVTCKDQEEIDHFWNALAADPNEGQCGWLKDRFGVSWQITPEGMDVLLNDPDTEKANRAMRAMLQMKKIDIAALKKAAEGN